MATNYRAIPARPMTAEQKALHERILVSNDPTSVTRAERNQINFRPPPDEEDRLCREKVGLSMAELMAKVMESEENANSLTQDETDIILRGADYDRNTRRGLGQGFWWIDLPDDEKQLATQVRALLASDYANEVNRRARFRDKAFDDERSARGAKRRTEARAAMDAKRRAMRTPWIQEMLDAKLPRWGFVIFRTAYGEGMDEKWKTFFGLCLATNRAHFGGCWRKAASIAGTFRPVMVSDSSLDGADVATLRERFKTMREQDEIPDRIATDCFLVVDEAILNHSAITSKTHYEAKAPEEADPWYDTFFIEAVDPDHDASKPAPTEGDLTGFAGKITIPLPKVFDWLYYCFFAKTADWEMRYKLVRAGPAEVTDPMSAIPEYRSDISEGPEKSIPLR
ncbi:hypothetical protein BJ170DRAFT_265949 [Xylariales sp. AK1849]|nr:hypothetical protein BJ170DRAFT_265949 [Xylariales sp. AK1849]